MTKRIVHQNGAGGISVIIPITGAIKPLTDLEKADFSNMEVGLVAAVKAAHAAAMAVSNQVTALSGEEPTEAATAAAELAALSIELEALVLELAARQADQVAFDALVAERLAMTFSVEEIAAKDVPTGLPYKIVDVTDIPTDRTARNDWFVDVADLTDGEGA